MTVQKHRNDQVFAGAVTFDGPVKSAPVSAGASTLTVDPGQYDGKTIYMDDGAGITYTLPAATGSGTKFTFIVSVAIAAGDYVIACAGADEFAGTILQTDTDTADALVSYPALAADNFDAITLGAAEQGGLIGDHVIVEDVASGIWHVRGHLNGSGVVVTPFSTV